ncbi:peptide ligase PGM1-related protein [Embleya sp. NPDC008237]|uniref:preATP grasp domain-containing protein n=1 Tax=Embleya sp. NPDC008237 TaxID=3363978 RepID=UPI0036F106FC
MVAAREDNRALVILANFVSPLTVDLRAASVPRRWSEQAPRKIWLTRPGHVLLVPLPLSESFRRYAFGRLGMSEDSVTVVTVPDIPRVPMAEAVAAHGLLEPLRALLRESPDARLLPTALDEACVALAADLGIGIEPYPAGGPSLRVVRTVADLNTKSGFRAIATRLGIRLPDGVVCTSANLARATDELLAAWKRVVVKPDRSAGGHGLRFVTRDDRAAATPPTAGERWVVEQYVDHNRAVSAQGHCAPDGVSVPFDGEMRMSGGSFAGYRSPLHDVPGVARAELATWTLALGRHLAAEGYRGPFSLDAVCAPDGTLHALECNVRRTATTTPHVLVTRLTGNPASAWSTGTIRTDPPCPFDAVAERLIATRLDFRPEAGQGVIIYTDRPVDGVGWRYVAMAPDHDGLTELETRLTASFGGDDAGG